MMHQHGVLQGSEELLYHVKQKRVQVVTPRDVMAKKQTKLLRDGRISLVRTEPQLVPCESVFDTRSFMTLCRCFSLVQMPIM